MSDEENCEYCHDTNYIDVPVVREESTGYGYTEHRAYIVSYECGHCHKEEWYGAW